jgi:predicted metalloprotease
MASIVPGAKPGVIASGPDPVNMPDEKPAGLSLGSNRHLFRKPRAQAPRNFVMNVGGGAGAGMGAGAGRKSGGPKKGLIIGGLAAIVIVIVVLVVVMLMGGGKKAMNGTTGDGSHDSFLKYANYLLTGKENTNELGSFDDSKDYTVMQKFAEKDAAFFDKAQELWKAFYEKITTFSTCFIILFKRMLNY